MADPTWVDGVTPLDSSHMSKLQTRDEKGQPSGYASLDPSGLVPAAQLPVTGGGGGGTSSVPTGAAFDFFGPVAPAGYLLCDGTAVSRTTYAALFAVIGTTYGAGDGSTTFSLPDTRGRVTVALGNHADVAALGANDGIAAPNRTPKHNHTNTFTLPNHAHALNDPGHGHNIGFDDGASPVAQVLQTSSRSRAFATDGGIAVSGTGVSVGNPSSNPPLDGWIGPGGAHPVDAPGYLVANKIIKT